MHIQSPSPSYLPPAKNSVVGGILQPTTTNHQPCVLLLQNAKGSSHKEQSNPVSLPHRVEAARFPLLVLE